jgi:hypothetical protein
MKTKTVAAVMMVACLAFGTARAADQFGVPVYPGATPHKPSSARFKQSIEKPLEGSCYRTTDGITKVVDFYKKRPELKPIAFGERGAKFELKGGSDAGGVDVLIQSPWLDVTTGKFTEGSLVCIVRQGK